MNMIGGLSPTKIGKNLYAKLSTNATAVGLTSRFGMAMQDYDFGWRSNCSILKA